MLFLDEALKLAKLTSSDSPVKIALRSMDEAEVYEDNRLWENLEPYLQRILHYHTHCSDYVVLLVIKRFAIGQPLDVEGWTAVAYNLVSRHLAQNHHHEVTSDLVAIEVGGTSCDVTLSTAGEAAFLSWVGTLVTDFDREVVAIDGKTVRRSLTVAASKTRCIWSVRGRASRAS